MSPKTGDVVLWSTYQDKGKPVVILSFCNCGCGCWFYNEEDVIAPSECIVLEEYCG